jgi:hypothetical protein
MKAKVLFFFLVLYGFSNCINADDTYITKILAMLTVFNLPERTKSQLVEKINEDVCRRVAKMSQEVDIGAEELPHFLGEVNGIEAKGFYQVYYHENENGVVDMASGLSALPTDKPYAGKSIGLLELSRPVDFDFSQLSDDEIIKGLRSELQKSDIDSDLKVRLSPFLEKDLCEKLRNKKPFQIFSAPYFLGGKCFYHVAFYCSAEKIEVDTKSKIIRYRDNTECSITSKKLSYPLGCNYSNTISKEDVEEAVTKIIEEEYAEDPDPVYTELIPLIVEDSQEYIKFADDRLDLPSFLDGELTLKVRYCEKNGEPVIFDSCLLGGSSEKDTIIIEKYK